MLFRGDVNLLKSEFKSQSDLLQNQNEVVPFNFENESTFSSQSFHTKNCFTFFQKSITAVFLLTTKNLSRNSVLKKEYSCDALLKEGETVLSKVEKLLYQVTASKDTLSGSEPTVKPDPALLPGVL